MNMITIGKAVTLLFYLAEAANIAHGGQAWWQLAVHGFAVFVAVAHVSEAVVFRKTLAAQANTLSHVVQTLVFGGFHLMTLKPAAEPAGQSA